MDEIRTYEFPVWKTRGSTLVRACGDTFIFVTAPPIGMGLNVGDEMPEEWDTVPANNLAISLLKGE